MKTTIKVNTAPRSVFGARLFQGYGPKPFLDKPEDNNGGDNNDDAAAEAARKAAEEAAAKAAEKEAAEEAARKAAEAEAAKADGKKPEGMSNSEWKLLKETMRRKAELTELNAKLKQFEGIDPEQVKKLLKEKSDAEEAARKAEREKAEKEGDWKRLQAMMAEEHGKEKTGLQSQIDELKAQLNAKDATIGDLTVGSAFRSSKFVSDKLVAPESITQAAFGGHFEFDAETGQVVGYDKPKGASERTKLVGGDGKALSFEAAMEKLVTSHPDRDRLLKANLKQGAGSTTDRDGKPPKKDGADQATGVGRIQAALAAKKAAAKK